MARTGSEGRRARCGARAAAVLLTGLAALGGACGGGEDAPDGGTPAEDPTLVDVPEEVVLPPRLAGEGGPDDAQDGPGVAPAEAEAVASAGEDPDPLGRVSISGPLDHRRHDGAGDLVLRLVAEDTRTAAEGLLELTGVRLELADRGTVFAATGRVRFASTGGRLVLGGPEDRIELDAARVDLDPDHPLAPLALTAGYLVASLEAELLELRPEAPGATPGAQEDRPRVRGARLDLVADAILAELATETLEAEGAARLRLLGPTGAEERRLEADRLTVTERGLDLTLVGIGAPALLVVHGRRVEDDLTLQAPRIEAGARRTDADPTTGDLVLERLVARGEGALERAGGQARGRDMTFTFAPDGTAGRVVLHGRPVLRVAELAGLGPAGDLELVADGPLELALDGALAFTTEAPATVSWGTWSLAAAGALGGRADEGSGRVELDGRGGVTLAGRLEEPAEGSDPLAGSLVYRTETVAVTLRTPVDPVTGSPRRDPGPGWPRVRLVGAGPTEVEGVDPEGYRARVACTDGMELALAGEDWSLPAGTGVTLELETATGTWTGRADELRDLDPTRLELEARGDVLLEETGGERRRLGRGGVVRLDGEDRLVLTGAGGQVARYEEGASWVEARRLERLGRRVTAAGAVRTHLELDRLTADLSCGELELTGLEGDDAQEALARLERLELGGGVEGSLAVDDDLLRLEVDTLTVLRTAPPLGLPPTLPAYGLTGTGPALLAWTTPEADWHVVADDFEALVQEVEAPEGASDPMAAAHVELVARGDVRVRERLAGFSGTGEVLHLDHGTTDRALLEGGAEPALVNGSLPDLVTAGVVGYRGRVARLALAGRALEADDVDLVLTGLVLPGSEGARLDPTALPADPPAWAVVCDQLRARVGMVELDGDVRVEGQDEGVPLRLWAELVVLSNPVQAADPEADPDLDEEALAGTGLAAFGQVKLRRGEAYEVSGDELTVAAGTRELRVAGSPARAVYAGLSSKSLWLRFDPVRMALDTGPGAIHVDPLLLQALRGARAVGEGDADGSAADVDDKVDDRTEDQETDGDPDPGRIDDGDSPGDAPGAAPVDAAEEDAP